MVAAAAAVGGVGVAAAAAAAVGCVQDYFFHQDGISNGGNRYATVLTYLSDAEEGGETVRHTP